MDDEVEQGELTDALHEVAPGVPDSAAEPEPTPSRVARWALGLGVVVVLVAFVGVLVATGAFETISDRDELERIVDDAGLWGPLLFLALMVTFVPLNVPGLVFVIPSTTLFGRPAGVVLSLAGGFLASWIGVVAARRLGRHRVEARMPERLLRLEQRLSARGFWAVVVSRMFTFLFQPIDWLWGLSSLPMRTVLVGTFIGLIPPTMVIALTGGGLVDLVL
ncbi:MAG: VTT domain-containing protein [Actinomycetota bacterium]|nr:VTT domain-containing protein [Actinomycetota bacterium]